MQAFTNMIGTLRACGIKAGGLGFCSWACTKFLSSPFTIRVPFFLLFGSNMGSLNQKGQKGTTQEPSVGFNSFMQGMLGSCTVLAGLGLNECTVGV